MADDTARVPAQECDSSYCVGLADLRGEVRAMEREQSTQLAAALKGVGNFNEFRLDMTSKIGFMHGVAWLFTIVNGLALLIFAAVFSWALSQIMLAARVVLEDYYAHHPAAALPKQEGQSTPARTLANEDRPPVTARW